MQGTLGLRALQDPSVSYTHLDVYKRQVFIVVLKDCRGKCVTIEIKRNPVTFY